MKIDPQTQDDVTRLMNNIGTQLNNESFAICLRLTKHDLTRLDKTRHDTARLDETRQAPTRHDRTEQHKAIFHYQSTKEGRVWTRQVSTGRGMLWQHRARQGD